jgi:hypothetical protein
MSSHHRARFGRAGHHEEMDADELYGLPLEQFIPERTALAKSLRGQKRRDEAAAVAGLRKPSVAAWAVNQLVRTQRDATKGLFDAGDALRDAQSELLDGRGDGKALREARERQRTAVEDLVTKARGLLTSEGYELSTAIIERVGDTLHAAALDEAAREQVRDGRLERELRHVGLGLGLGEGVFGLGGEAAAPHKGAGKPKDTATPQRGAKRSAGAEGRAKGKADAAAGESDGSDQPASAKSPAKGTAKQRAKDAAAERRAEREREAHEREQAERARRERAEARTAARAAEATAKRRAKAAGRALEAAERERDEAEERLRESEAALLAAREEAAAAEEALERAQSELEAL